MPSTAKKTFEAAAQAQAQLIVQLSDNQPTFYWLRVSRQVGFSGNVMKLRRFGDIA
jgi:hypothetical protein